MIMNVQLPCAIIKFGKYFVSTFLKAGFELPTYEEAEEMRLYPDKIPGLPIFISTF